MSDKTLDDTNLAIIGLLQQGRRSYNDIAAELGLSEATIRSRVGKLTAEGIIQVKALVSPKLMPDGYDVVYIGVQLNTPIIMNSADELSRLPGVVSVAVVTGRYDIILTVVLKPGFKLIDFYNEMLKKHSSAIKSNETFVVYEDVNLSLPYPF